MYSLVPACATHKIQWVHVSAIYTQHSTHRGAPPLTRFNLCRGCLSRSSNCKFQNTPVRLTSCWRSQLETQVLFTWHVASSLAALMRPWRCDSLALSQPDISNPLLRVVVCNSVACQHVSCRVRLQPFWWMTNTSLRTRAPCQQCTRRCSFASWRRPFSTAPWHHGASDHTARSTSCLAVLCQMLPADVPGHSAESVPQLEYVTSSRGLTWPLHSGLL